MPGLTFRARDRHRRVERFLSWKSPLKWGLFVVALLVWATHEQKNIREAAKAVGSGAAPEATPPSAPNQGGGGFYLVNLNAVGPADGAAMIIGSNAPNAAPVHIVESVLSPGIGGVYQNGHVENYNSLIDTTGPVIQNGDIHNLGGGIIERGATTPEAHDAGKSPDARARAKP